MWPAVIALVASAALQQINSSMAASRQNRAAQEAMRRQREYQERAEKIALQNANEYQHDKREQKQEDIAEEMTQNYYQPVESAQIAHAENAGVQGNVSSDYQQAKTASDAKQLKSAKELAQLLGRQNSAQRLRQNEAITMAGNANDIARIRNFANGQYNADQIAIQEAGRGNPFLQLGSQILGVYGGARLTGGKDGVTSLVSGGTKTGLLDSGFANMLKNRTKQTGGTALV